MLQRIVNRLVEYFGSKSPYKNDEEKEKVTYILAILVRETSAIFLLIIMISLFGEADSFLISFSIVLFTRTFVGGLHETASIKCFFHTLIFFSLAIVISKWKYIERISWFVYVTYFILILRFAPLNNKKRGQFSKLKRNRMKLTGICGLTISFLIGIVLTSCSGIVTGTLLIEMIEYLLAIIQEKGGEKYVGEFESDVG